MPNLATRETTSSTGEHPISRVATRLIGCNRAVRAEIQMRMIALDAYFSAFVERANEARIAVRLEYPIDGAGTLRMNRLQDFSLRTDDPELPSKVSLRFEAHGSSPLRVLPPTSEDYVNLRRYLFDHRLEFTSGIAATVSKITLKPVVPIAVRFKADFRAAIVRLRIRNLHGLGVNAYKLMPNEVDAELMAALESHVLHEPSDFFELTRHRRARPVARPA